MSRDTLRFAAAAAAAVVLFGLPVAATGTPPKLPTDDAVQAMVDAGEFASAAEQLERLVALRGAAAAHNDRCRDLLLLAECRLGLRQGSRLAKVLQQAVAAAEDAHDLEALGRAAGLQLALRASRDLVYTPAANRRVKYDLAVPAELREAGPLVFHDALAEVREQWRAAKGQRDLKPVVDVADRFALVRADEHALTGGTAESDTLGKEIERGAATMVTQKLATLAKQVQNARRTANYLVYRDVMRRNGTIRREKVKRGLDQREMADLHAVGVYCAALAVQIDRMNRGFAEPLQLGTAAQSAEGVRQAATDLENEVLNTR